MAAPPTFAPMACGGIPNAAVGMVGGASPPREYVAFGLVAQLLALVPVLNLITLFTNSIGAALWVADLERDGRGVCAHMRVHVCVSACGMCLCAHTCVCVHVHTCASVCCFAFCVCARACVRVRARSCVCSV